MGSLKERLCAAFFISPFFFYVKGTVKFISTLYHFLSLCQREPT